MIMQVDKFFKYFSNLDFNLKLIFSILTYSIVPYPENQKYLVIKRKNFEWRTLEIAYNNPLITFIITANH